MWFDDAADAGVLTPAQWPGFLGGGARLGRPVPADRGAIDARLTRWAAPPWAGIPVIVPG